jgi:ribosomal protein S9
MGAATVNKTSGSDAKVKVNSEQANAVGTEVYYTGAGVSLSFNLAKNAVNPNLSITITGGGTVFQLGDESSSQVSLGLAGIEL